MNIFITGGANGIGRATVNQLIDNGHEVIVYDIDEQALRDLPEPVTRYHGDVYDLEQVQRAIQNEEFDVLINCAGYQEQGALEDMSLETVQKHFETNVFGLVAVTKAALPMLRERNGRIINVSSLAGKVAGPFWGAYAGSKHAVEGISEALRMEVDDFGVDVVVIAPGPIQTGFNERGRQMLKQYLPDSVYADRYRQTLRTEIGGATAEHAASVLLKAVEADRPKARYTITWLSWLAPKLRAVLPRWMWDRFVKQR